MLGKSPKPIVRIWGGMGMGGVYGLSPFSDSET